MFCWSNQYGQVQSGSQMQEQIHPEPNLEQKEEIQEDQIVPEAEEPADYDEESTVEAATATEVTTTVEQDFKRKTWNFEHFGSDENRRGFKFTSFFFKIFNLKAAKKSYFWLRRWFSSCCCLS